MATNQQLVQRWSLERITMDLRKLREEGIAPDPYALKRKYGFLRLSVFFPTLDIIADVLPDLKDFIEGIFNRVTDHRDLNYRKGDCTCENCRE